VALSEIRDVNEVAHTRAVNSRVVSAKHVQVRQVAASDALDIRHQVVGNTLRILADLARPVSANRVEIAKANG